MSCSLDRTTLASYSFHATNLGPIKSMRQGKFKGEVLNTSATMTCLCHTM
jgi:hypothetical protein